MKFLTLVFIVILLSIDVFGQVAGLTGPRNRRSWVGKDGVKYVCLNWEDNIPEQEPTSEMHRNNIGKIFFSTERILFKNEDPSKIKNRFTVSDNIYGRAYMICSAANDTLLMDDDMNDRKHRQGVDKLITKKKIQVAHGGSENSKRAIGYRLYVNGELNMWNIENIYLDKESLTHTTRQFWIVPKEEDGKISRYWREIVDKLPNGEHNIKVECIVSLPYESYRPLATGEFTLVKGKNDVISTYLKFADLEEGRKDPQLAQDVIKIMNQTFEKNGLEGNIEKVKFKTDWIASVVGPYNNRKRIREIRFYLYTTHGKQKCQVEEFTVAQSHNGSAFSGPIYFGRVIPSSKQWVDCE